MSRAIASSANPHPIRLVCPNCGSEPAREDLRTVVIVPKRQAIVYELGEGLTPTQTPQVWRAALLQRRKLFHRINPLRIESGLLGVDAQCLKSRLV